MKNLYHKAAEKSKKYFKNLFVLFVLITGSLFSSTIYAQTYRSSSQSTAPSGDKTLDVSKPASLQVGDVMIAAISVRPWNVNINGVPTGWVFVRNTAAGSTGEGGDNQQSIYYKIVTATDLLPTTTLYQWKFNQSEGSAGGIIAFSGVENSYSPIDKHAGAPSGSGLTFSSPSINTTYPNEVVIGIHAYGSSGTWTNPVGATFPMVQRVDIASRTVPNVYGVSMEMSHGVKVTAGATGSVSATASNDAEVGVSQIIALMPNTQISYPGTPYCKNEGTAPVTQIGIPGGVYSSTTGLSINLVSGAVDLSASNAGTYVVTYKYGITLQYSTTTSITVNPVPTEEMSGSVTICQNSAAPNITFASDNGTAPYTFTYKIGGGANQTVTASGNSVTVSQATAIAGTFAYTLVSVADANACTLTQSDVETITISPLPTATIGGATTVCQNATAPNITFTGGGATAPYTFTYKIDGGSDQTVTTTSGNSVTVARPTTNVGTYTYTLVSVSSANSCSQLQSASAAITVNPSAVASISGDATVCQNSTAPSITFTGSGATAPYTFTYKINSGVNQTVTTTTGNSVTLTQPTTTAGSFTYTLVSVSSPNSCSQLQSGSAAITVTAPVGTPVFTAGSTSSRCQTAATTTYAASASNATSITYSLDAISTLAGNSIISSTGAVTFAAGWTGNSTIIATATGCYGPTTATHTVTTAIAPLASFNYTANPYCTNGGNASISFSGTGGGTFSSSPAGLSINGTTGFVVVQASTPGAYTVNYTIASTASCPTYVVSAPLTINIHAIWNGSVSRNWHDPNNWSCGGVPTLTSNTVIPSGMPRYPIIYSGIGTTNNLTIQTGASIVDSASLKVGGIIYNSDNGSVDALAGKVEFASNSYQVIPSKIFNLKTIKDIVISNAGGIKLSGPLRVTGSVAFGNVNNTVFTTGDSLTLASVATSDAQIKDITNAGINSGNTISGLVIVERYMPAKRAYRLATAPVNSTKSIKFNWMENSLNPDRYNRVAPYPGYGTNITGMGDTTNGFDPTQTHNPSMFTFNNVGQAWVPIPNTGGVMTAGNAYRIIVRGDRNIDMNSNTPTPTPTTLRATGTVVTGNFTVVKSGSAATANLANLSVTPNAYNLIANPYASAINWLTVNKTDIGGTIYIFDPTIAGSGGRGGYSVYNCIVGAVSNNGSIADNYIQSGQSFFVQSSGPNPSITFKETDKAGLHRPVFRTGSELPNVSVQILLPAQQQTSESADGAKVYFSEDFDNSIGKEDSYKFANQDENIAIISSGNLLSIEARRPVATGDSIQLKLWQLTQKNYLLKLNFNNFSYGLEAYLKDKYLSTITQLNTTGETVVPVTITSDAASTAPDRYKIIFEKFTTLPLHLLGIKAVEKNGGVEVGWIAESESNMDRYEIEKSVDGHRFVTAGTVKAKIDPGTSSNYTWFDLMPNKGDNFYKIKSVDKEGAIKYSNVAKVKLEKGVSVITLFPNPIQGKVIRLQFTGIKKANYNVSLFNSLGDKVHNGTISHGGGSANHSIELKTFLPKGVYQLHVSDNLDKETISVLVQ
ncbi:T9SS type A sorting domain-containing protein [Segetibacter sp.]|uniref:T9SS type A sorting domain-containing protein n=1 Tax=Segetibacter sp. TaxID=2231182 RepID=UPI002608F37C|nr:T9SS type A sorting domain-containing protein [Segetibacter sp.]MCW3080323.1 C-terminal target protein [Segetibacter sp.]